MDLFLAVSGLFNKTLKIKHFSLDTRNRRGGKNTMRTDQELKDKQGLNTPDLKPRKLMNTRKLLKTKTQN